MRVSQPYIAAVEGGRQNLTLSQIAAIASALGVGVEVIFTAPGSQSPTTADIAAEEGALLEQLTAVTEALRMIGESVEVRPPLEDVRLGLLERLASLRPNVGAYAEAAARTRRQLRRTAHLDVGRERREPEARTGGRPGGS
jgi:transcriptional regulator with XRE-family HTH domain